MFKIKKDWYELLKDEFEKPYYKNLTSFLEKEYAEKIIYPKPENVFNALNYCSIESIKVVIIGQDPYHEPNQAHGLCFSVEQGVNYPPSLKNIFKELKAEMNVTIETGNLTSWAKQGVLLLNTVLTVEKSKANSHKGKGWEIFTTRIIQEINKINRPIVFILWGASAQSFTKYLDNPNFLILKSVHPSPLSAYNGFFGNNHFIKTNQFLSQHNIAPIDFNLKDNFSNKYLHF